MCSESVPEAVIAMISSIDGWRVVAPGFARSVNRILGGERSIRVPRETARGANMAGSSGSSKLRALPKRRGAINPAERQLRIDLAAAFRLVAHFGWDDL